TTDSGSVCLGSNPSSPASFQATFGWPFSLPFLPQNPISTAENALSPHTRPKSSPPTPWGENGEKRAGREQRDGNRRKPPRRLPPGLLVSEPALPGGDQGNDREGSRPSEGPRRAQPGTLAGGPDRVQHRRRPAHAHDLRRQAQHSRRGHR